MNAGPYTGKPYNEMSAQERYARFVKQGKDPHELGLSPGTVHARLTRGWSDGEALKPPMRRVGIGSWENS